MQGRVFLRGLCPGVFCDRLLATVVWKAVHEAPERSEEGINMNLH